MVAIGMLLIGLSFLGAFFAWRKQLEKQKWFLWAAFGWGIGLLFHAVKTFRWNPFFTRSWEERKIREFMEEDEKTGRGE